MKKSITTLFIGLAVSLSLWGMGAKDTGDRQNEVVVYAYDSFAGEWGAGPAIAEKFEKKTGIKVTMIDCGSAIETFNRAVLEKDSPRADVIIGIDNNLAPQAKKSNILEAYKPNGSEAVSEQESALGGGWYLTPYDYSHFAIIYDTKSSVPAPTSLEDLTNDVYRRKIILMDPRTSSTGLGFLSWTVSVYGEKYADYWERLKPNILTMTSGWSEGWGMFLNGEAPLVVSYTTSPAYNVEYDKNYRYKTLVFGQGHVEQVEGAGLLKGAKNKAGAKAFIDFLISEEAQSEIPLSQWMYPANKNIVLPKSYQSAAPVPQKTLATDSAKTAKAVDAVMDIISK